MLNWDLLKSTKNDFSSNHRKQQVHTFSEDGGASDHLLMKQKHENKEGASKYPFTLYQKPQIRELPQH